MREAFLQALSGHPTDKVVWTADISYWISGQGQRGLADPRWQTEEGYLQLCRELGLMPYYWYEKFWLGEPEYDTTIQVESLTAGPRTIRLWRTPLGELREESVFLPESCSVGITRHPVAGPEDLPILRYILEHRQLRPACIADYRQRLELWAKYDGIPSIALPRSPLAAFFYEWAGVEQGTYLLMDYPKELGEILALLEEQEAPVLDAVCALAPPLVHFADNLSSDNLGGFYQAYMAGPHRRRLERLHAAGVRCAVHLDGTVRGLLPQLAAAGFDAIEALTPEPAGDLAVEEMRTVARSRTVCLWGGLPGVMFSPPYTWRDMETHLRRVLAAWRGTPFVLGVADQVPPDGEIAFCRRIAEALPA